MTDPYPRISGRKGSTIRLNVAFYANGVPADPYAITRIDIYQNTVATENLVAQVDVLPPDDPLYPAPLVRVSDTDDSVCCGDAGPGRYYYDLDVPDSFEAPEIYIDQWHFIGDELVASTGSTVDVTDETLWDSQCNNFYVAPSNTWYIDDCLIVPRFEFEALDKDIVKPEIRTIEVGIMPLPRYDYDYNRIAPLLPQLNATISIFPASSGRCDAVVDDAVMCVGYRQGAHRSDPFVFRYTLDSSSMQRGTYTYYVTLHLPNGETRVSKPMHLTIQ